MSIENFKPFFEQDIEEAYSLPFSAYTDINLFGEELKRIFYSDWFFVCHENQIPNKGDYFSFQVANECLVAIRGRDNEVRVLSNHCRHRGSILLNEGFGNTKNIVCPYHSWSYSFEGKLKGSPFTGSVEVKKEEHCLHQVKLESWRGLIFINFKKDAEPLFVRYKGIEKYLDLFKVDKMNFSPSSKIETWNCNWKLAMENAMESYHLFSIHKNTLEKTTPTKDAYYVEGGPDWTLTGGKIAGVQKGFVEKFLGANTDHFYHYVLISLPPNFVGVLTYESLGWIQILPTKVDEITVVSGAISPYKGEASRDEQDFLTQFYEEDRVICENMQKSMHSKFSKGGKLVELETIVTDFRQYMARRLFQSDVGRHKVIKNTIG